MQKRSDDSRKEKRWDEPAKGGVEDNSPVRSTGAVEDATGVFDPFPHANDQRKGGGDNSTRGQPEEEEM